MRNIALVDSGWLAVTLAVPVDRALVIVPGKTVCCNISCVSFITAVFFELSILFLILYYMGLTSEGVSLTSALSPGLASNEIYAEKLQIYC